MRTRKGFHATLAAMAAFLLLSCAGLPEEIPPENRLVVALAGIENVPSPSVSLEEEFVAALLGTRRFRLIERSRLDALLAENELSLSALGDPSARPKMLGVIGADAILFVNMANLREYSGRRDDRVTGWWDDVTLGIEAKASARLVSVSSGEIMAAASATGVAEAGRFFGAMGLTTVDKGKDELAAEARSVALAALALELARAAPERR